MIINKINTFQYSKTDFQTSPTFKAYMPEKFYRHAEKCTLAVEKVERKALNKILMIGGFLVTTFNKLLKKLKGNASTKNFHEITMEDLKKAETDPEYQMLMSYELSKIMTRGKEVEINIENNELQDLINNDEACIFIMNHDRQKEDPKLLCFFNALLAREYLCNEKGATCPRPKILINKDILETSNEEKKAFGKALGAVGIDSGIYCSNKFANGKIMSPIIKDFIENKANIFIFPEGRLAAFPKLNPQWKFQTGIADIIKSATQKKEQVKVVPLGFAYKNGVGGIHIGKPILFKKENNSIKFQPGEINQNIQDKNYIDFIHNSNSENGWYTITDAGDTVMHKNSSEYIAGILCESLTLSKKNAAASLKNVGTDQDADTIFTLGDEFNE